jgi:hypothetical protein
MFFKMLMATPIEDIGAFPKLSKAYYSLLAAVAKDHTVCLARLSSELFKYVWAEGRWPGRPGKRRPALARLLGSYLVATLAQGIKAVTTAVSTQCCTTLDSIITFVVTKCVQLKEGDCPAPWFASHVLDPPARGARRSRNKPCEEAFTIGQLLQQSDALMSQVRGGGGGGGGGQVRASLFTRVLKRRARRCWWTC